MKRVSQTSISWERRRTDSTVCITATPNESVTMMILSLIKQKYTTEKIGFSWDHILRVKHPTMNLAVWWFCQVMEAELQSGAVLKLVT